MFNPRLKAILQQFEYSLDQDSSAFREDIYAPNSQMGLTESAAAPSQRKATTEKSEPNHVLSDEEYVAYIKTYIQKPEKLSSQ